MKRKLIGKLEGLGSVQGNWRHFGRVFMGIRVISMGIRVSSMDILPQFQNQNKKLDS
jgi:hypothetical protein